MSFLPGAFRRRWSFEAEGERKSRRGGGVGVWLPDVERVHGPPARGGMGSTGARQPPADEVWVLQTSDPPGLRR